jgi:hypothetical protein
MKLFRRKQKKYEDKLEERLDSISDLTRGLERKEFNSLLDAVKMVFEARQKLKGVKTNEEKELDDIDVAERILTIESEKKEKK